jgi:hypothetical protein
MKRASGNSLLVRPIWDFIGAALLLSLTGLHIILLLQNRDLGFATDALIIISAALNVSGLLIAVAYQRTVFTITFFFTLFFFSLAPMQQMMDQFDPLMADASILMRAFGFCLIFSAICFVALLAMGPAPTQKHGPQATSQSFSSGACALLLGLLWGAIAIGLIGFGKDLLTDRVTYAEHQQAETSLPILLLYTGALRPFTIYGSVVGLWLAWSHRRMGWSLSFGSALCGGLLLSNPLITPRFEVATLICTIIFYLGGRRHCRLLVTALLMGVAISPFFNLFRNHDGSHEYGDIGSFLVNGDYDAFSLLCHTIWHVDNYGLDYGNNIISAIFFFVPRSVWPTKNEITPYYLMESLQMYRGLWNPNLSEPLIAEGYFAFGVIGVVAVTVIYVLFAWFLELKAGENRLNAIYLFCCAAPPLLFVLLRGSLLVGMSVIVGNLLVMLLTVRIAKSRLTTKSNSRNFRVLRPATVPFRSSAPHS